MHNNYGKKWWTNFLTATEYLDVVFYLYEAFFLECLLHPCVKNEHKVGFFQYNKVWPG